MARMMSEARRKRLSDAGKARFAALPRDAACRKCETPIVRQFIVCRDCWASFSDEQRSAINARFVPGIPMREQPDPAYWSAIEDACK